MAPCDPGNMVARPIMLKYAAVADMLKADISVNMESFMLFITPTIQRNLYPIRLCRLYKSLQLFCGHT